MLRFVSQRNKIHIIKIFSILLFVFFSFAKYLIQLIKQVKWNHEKNLINYNVSRLKIDATIVGYTLERRRSERTFRR